MRISHTLSKGPTLANASGLSVSRSRLLKGLEAGAIETTQGEPMNRCTRTSDSRINSARRAASIRADGSETRLTRIRCGWRSIASFSGAGGCAGEVVGSWPRPWSGTARAHPQSMAHAKAGLLGQCFSACPKDPWDTH